VSIASINWLICLYLSGIDIEQSLDVSITKNIEENTYVSNSKTLDVSIDADIKIKGSEGYRRWKHLTVDGLASAEIKNNQILKENMVINEENPNTATISGHALEGAEGNIGVNVAAGDNNAQDNLAAIAASEQENSMADAMIFKEQLSLLNFTCNKGRTNSASLDGSALMGATGNIGVNVVAGNNNAQSNMTAIAAAPTKVGIAKVGIHQESAGNMTMNKPVKVEEVQIIPVRLGLSATLDGGYIGGYYGVAGGNYSGSEGGTYRGTTSGVSYQANNFYPDIWTVNRGYEPHDQHPHSPSEIGHLDMDNATQGAIANPYREGVGGLAFDNRGTESGTYSGSESGSYAGLEAGIEGGYLGGSILGTVSGNIPVVIRRNVNMINTASLGGNALRGATGNIGVNIAAGTGNLQANALAVTYIAPVNGGGNGGGEGLK
ncbi:hypothetical protein, partial [Dissulfurispira sp.]|uniref:hypothetical protein n=1 Tax=Dissulfurispira sp. TaxID=2817609 RepID=UPI002FD90EF6